MNNTKDIANIFVNALNNEEYVIDKTGCKTIEIIGNTIEIKSQRSQLLPWLFAITGGKINHKKSTANITI